LFSLDTFVFGSKILQSPDIAAFALNLKLLAQALYLSLQLRDPFVFFALLSHRASLME
jgi:hypothetical protein